MMMMIMIIMMMTTGQLTARDWATYRCVATNDHGDSAASVTLTGILLYIMIYKCMWQCGMLCSTTTSVVDISNMILSGGVAVWSLAKFQLPIPENFLHV